MRFSVQVSRRRCVLVLCFSLAFIALLVGSFAVFPRLFDHSWVGAAAYAYAFRHLQHPSNASLASLISPCLMHPCGGTSQTRSGRRQIDKDKQSFAESADDEGRGTLTDPLPRFRPSTDEYAAHGIIIRLNTSEGALSGNRTDISDDAIDDPTERLHVFKSETMLGAASASPLPLPSGVSQGQSVAASAHSNASVTEQFMAVRATASPTGIPEPTVAPYPPPRRRAGARVLVLMADNRDLTANATWDAAGYSALAAVANAQFALRHGYEFRYVRLLTDKMVSEAK